MMLSRLFNNSHNSLGYNFNQQVHHQPKPSTQTDQATIATIAQQTTEVVETIITDNKEEVVELGLLGHLIKILFMAHVTGAVLAMFHPSALNVIPQRFVRDNNPLLILLITVPRFPLLGSPILVQLIMLQPTSPSLIILRHTTVMTLYMLGTVKVYPFFISVPHSFTLHIKLFISHKCFMSQKSNKIFSLFKKFSMIIMFTLNFTLLFLL